MSLDIYDHNVKESVRSVKECKNKGDLGLSVDELKLFVGVTGCDKLPSAAKYWSKE